MTIYQQALSFVLCGIGVIPVRYKDKKPDLSKIPGWEAYKTTLPTQAELEQWFLHSQLNNYGVLAGWTGLTILDFDDASEYLRWQSWCTKVGGQAGYVSRFAFQVLTSRGVHVYIRLPHQERNRKLGDKGKLEIKANGYVLGPDSTHPSGAVYTPLRDVWNFPMVDALSDVLPTALLIQDAAKVTNTQSQPAAPAQPVDPWAAAMNPKLYSTKNSSSGDDLVTTIRKHFKCEDFLADMRQSGSHWMVGLCPLHDDQSSSFWLDTQKQICGCFAGCTPKPLDVINLYARLNGLTNVDAIHALGMLLP